MKKLVFLSMLFFSVLTIAQENYKVIVIPKKFDFLKVENQYNLNTLCELFFEKEGFAVFHDEDLPKEIANNRCNVLFLKLIDEGSIFTTKVKIEIKDCQNNIVAISDEAESREKDYKLAYNEVTRAALISMRGSLNITNSHINSNGISPKIEVKKETLQNQATALSSSNTGLNSVITSKGYNLVDENKNLKFELLKTTNPTIFIAKKGNIQGIFTLNGKNSKFESYQNDVLVVEEVEVKF